MLAADPTERIKRRRQAIAQRLMRIAQLERMLPSEKAKLKAEDEELAAAERVFSRLANANDDDLFAAFADPAVAVATETTIEDEDDGSSIPRQGTPRPPNIPTTPEMFNILLADAERAGKIGLQGRDLVVGIGQRWWPGVGWNSVLPTAFALVTKERLERKGKLFARVKKSAVIDRH